MQAVLKNYANIVLFNRYQMLSSGFYVYEVTSPKFCLFRMINLNLGFPVIEENVMKKEKKYQNKINLELINF